MPSFISLNYALEKSVTNFLSASVSDASSSLYQVTSSFMTGIGNVDIDETKIPGVKVACSSMNETYMNTGVYEASVDITVIEMAADTANLGELAYNVFNVFNNPNQITKAINFSNTGSYQFATWQIRTPQFRTEVSGDALINTGTYIFICALAPTTT
jgi:phage-related tail fiber protein